MSILETIPEEDLGWDSYYRLYYDDDDFQNSIYTPPRMADYDPTTENKTPALDIALDNVDDDDDTTPPDTPGPPGAASTPYQPGATYHPGEEYEMSTLPQEQSGVVHGPGEPAWKALTYIYIQTQVRLIWKLIWTRQQKGSRLKWPALVKLHTIFLQKNGQLA